MKIGIITQARMGSQRLPGKIFKTIDDKPMLAYHVERVRKTGLPFVVATTTMPQDDKTAQFCHENNLSHYRGSEDDVLSRYYEAAKEYGFEHIIRVTSDCPLIDPGLINEAVEVYKSENAQDLYLSNCLERTYPRGFDFEIFSFKLLEEAYYTATEKGDREHVTPYIHQNRSGKVHFKHIKNNKDFSHLRITVDTSDDFLLLKTLIENHECHLKGYSDIIRVFKAFPQLAHINNHVEQKVK